MRRLLRSLQPAAFAALQRTLFLRGRDVTEEVVSGPLMVVAPHPDDETLGCAVSIMRATDAGHPVHVVIVCDGRNSHRSVAFPPEKMAALRREEVLEACRRMGVPPEHVTLLGHEDRVVARSARAVADGLEAAIAQAGPARILVPSGIDKHPDHRAVHTVVCRLVARGRITQPVYEYPVWFWTAGTWVTAGAPLPRRLAQLAYRPLRTALLSQPLLVRTDGYLQRKRHALEAFASQMRNITGEPGWPVLEEAFLASFLRRYELLFPLLRAGAPAIPQPEDDPYAIRSGGLAWGWGAPERGVAG